MERIFEPKYRKQLARWIVGVVAACILIYLAARYIHIVAQCVAWIFTLLRPLLLGLLFALALNTPMQRIEKQLFRKNPKCAGLRRPLALVLAIVLILAVLAGVLILIVPKIADAATVLVQSVADGLNWIADTLTVKELDKIPFASVRRYLENIDWAKIEDQFLIWAKGISGTIADYLSGVVSSMAKGVGEFFVGIAFSIYILLRKETLKSQFERLIYAWLPAKFGHGILHVFDVCSSAFQNFVTGQVTEAFILGSLCAIGMGILRLPYAPLIGALVGVTAIIPILGAFVSTVVGAFMIMMVSPVKAIIFVIFLLLLQQIEGNFIYPKVVGSKISLPAIWVFTAVTIGGKLCGPLGMLLGVPIMSAVCSLLKEATINRENKKQSTDAVDCPRTGDES